MGRCHEWIRPASRGRPGAAGCIRAARRGRLRATGYLLPAREAATCVDMHRHAARCDLPARKDGYLGKANCGRLPAPLPVTTWACSLQEVGLRRHRLPPRSPRAKSGAAGVRVGARSSRSCPTVELLEMSCWLGGGRTRLSSGVGSCGLQQRSQRRQAGTAIGAGLQAGADVGHG